MADDLEKRLAEWAEKHNDFAGDDVRAILERCARLERELAEWASKDGNSPGYNRQKAATYGDKAYRLRCERDEARDRCASLEAALRLLCSDAIQTALKDGMKADTKLAVIRAKAEATRALLGPSPEGSPPAPKGFAVTVDERTGQRLYHPPGEPPEGTETRKAASPTRRRQRAERAEAKKRMRSAPSPLHGETGGRRERPEVERYKLCAAMGSVTSAGELELRICELADYILDREAAWLDAAEALSTRTTPDPDDWRTHPELRDLLAKIPDDSDRTRAFRLLNEALSPGATLTEDPERPDVEGMLRAAIETGSREPWTTGEYYKDEVEIREGDFVVAVLNTDVDPDDGDAEPSAEALHVLASCPVNVIALCRWALALEGKGQRRTVTAKLRELIERVTPDDDEIGPHEHRYNDCYDCIVTGQNAFWHRELSAILSTLGGDE